MFRLIRLFMILVCATFAIGAHSAYAESEFTVTTTPDTTSFSFQTDVDGTFEIDWGDGSDIEKITTKISTFLPTTISHTYTTAGTYNIGISGQATRYRTPREFAVISFDNNKNVASISGSLGAVFGTLDDGSQPIFYRTFWGCSNLTDIPAGLFTGIDGDPAPHMFKGTFMECTGLTDIPADLFTGIEGAPAPYMFANTFRDCKKITDSIPQDLFGDISGTPAEGMFYNTFYGCSGLTGSIPMGLFSGISGAPASSMFSGTFSGCEGLTGGIPADLFAGISGAPASDMFHGTFDGCGNLTGSIPTDLFSGIKGAPADSMFYATFIWCYNLTGYVDGRTFTVPAGNAYLPYTNTFTSAFSMNTICPAGTYAVPKPDPEWTVAVCLPCPESHPSSDVEAPSIDMCYSSINCLDGTYYDAATSKCETCPANSYCPGGTTKQYYDDTTSGDGNAISCSTLGNDDETGNWAYSDAGAKTAQECHRICETHDIINGTAHPVSERAYYDTQCEYTYTNSNGEPCEPVDGACRITDCDSDYELINDECVPCNREHATSYADNGNCVIATCADGYHSATGLVCESDIMKCDAPNATHAQREWDDTLKSFGPCTIHECADEYHLVSNSCVTDTRMCAVENGSGAQDWDPTTKKWGECIATSCDPGYTNDPLETNERTKQCGACRNMFAESGERAASQYVRGCEIATCMYQGEIYNLDGNECVPICIDDADETGAIRRVGNKCIRACNPGFVMW